MTFAEQCYVDAELSFARWISGLGGWAHADSLRGNNDPYAQIANNWIDGHHTSAGRLRRAKKDRADVVELTDAGRTWCREQGIS